MSHKLLRIVVLIALIVAMTPPTAVAQAAVSDWKLPLPAGKYVITQGDQDNCVSTHCRTSGLGQWVYCAIDIATVGDMDGLPLLAPADGDVILTNYQGGGAGNYMAIKHTDGLVSQYQHLQEFYVKKGDKVKQGQMIGRVDSTGKSTGAHLHFGVFKDETYKECLKITSIDGNTSFKTNDTVTSTNNQVGTAPGQPPAPITPAPPTGRKPAPPSLSVPNDNEWVASATEVVFRWNSVANAAQYYIEYAGGPYGTLNSGWINDTSFRVGKMWEGDYQWRVKARNTMGESDWSGTWKFRVQGPSPTPTHTATFTPRPAPQAPAVPTLRDPSNNNTLPQTTDVTLSWNTATNAAQYYVEFSGGPYGTLNSGWINGASHHIGTMWPGTYTWHVKAKSASGVESNWSETRTFKIQGPSDTPTSTATPTLRPAPQAPATPTLRDPANNASLPPTTDVWFAWNLSPDVAQYYLEYAGGPYGTLNSGWINDTAFHIGTMWPGTYTWHVKAKGMNGVESNWSETRTFTIVAAPQQGPSPTFTPTFTPTWTPTAPPAAAAVPSLRDPANNGSYAQSTEIVYSWNSVSGATQYYVEFWGGPYTTLNSNWISATSYRIGQMWPGTYFWHVKARNSSNVESAWSETRTFTIQQRPSDTPTFTNTAPPVAAVSGNIASRASRSPDGINSSYAFDGNLSTFWTNGLGHGFTLTLRWPDPMTINRIIVWDRPQNSPDNNQINALIVTLSNGVNKRFGMDSGGRRCIDINLPSAQTVNSITLKADDASGNNGLSEVEVWVGSKNSGPSCSNSGSMP
jgi:pyruvate/2-oxoglutarate dehydrogenase complex dihydrolipoamide acyltransferase (E2) component